MAKQTFTTGSVLTAAQMNSLQANDYNWTVSQKTASYVLVAADAGTRIEMNSGSATTITVNTGLFAAGDTLFIQNIGAGATTVTAGTATVNKATAGSLTLAQYQGGTLYFVSASSAVFFADAGYTPPLTTKGDLFGYDTAAARIPIGTNNQVLTADSTQALGLKWATPAGSTASYSLIGTGTTTSGSTVTVSGISGMNNLMIIFKAISTDTAGSSITLRFNADSTSSYARAGYTGVYLEPTYSPNSQIDSGSQAAQNSFLIGTITSGAAAGTLSGYGLVAGCNSSGTKMLNILAGNTAASGWTSNSMRISGGIYTGTSTISSVSVITGSGTFDAGSFDVYGSA